jgi:hypothetical protein
VFRAVTYSGSFVLRVFSVRDFSMLLRATKSARVQIPDFLGGGGLLEDVPGDWLIEFSTWQDDNPRDAIDTWPPLFFGSITDGFEQYLCIIEVWRQLKRWKSVITAYQYHLFLPVVLEMAQKTKAYDLAPFKDARRLRCEYFFCLVARESHGIIQSQRSEIQRFTVRWMSLLKETEREINPQAMFSRASLTSVFCQCVDRLRFVNMQRLASLFQMILEVTEILATLAQVDGISTGELLRKTIVISRSVILPEFYLIVLAFCVGRPSFQLLMSRKELKNWLLFEKVMLISVTTDEALREQFAGLHDAFGMT